MSYPITKLLNITGCSLGNTVSTGTPYSFSSKPVPGLSAYKNVPYESMTISLSFAGGGCSADTTITSINYDTEIISFNFTVTMIYGGTPTLVGAQLQIKADLPDILEPYYYLPRNANETPKSVSSVFEYERQASSSTITYLPNFKIPITPDKLAVPTFPSTVTSHSTTTGGYLFGGRYNVTINRFNDTNSNIYALKAGYTPYAQNNAHTVIN